MKKSPILNNFPPRKYFSIVKNVQRSRRDLPNVMVPELILLLVFSSKAVEVLLGENGIMVARMMARQSATRLVAAHDRAGVCPFSSTTSTLAPFWISD